MAEIETKPEGSRVRIRDVVKKVEPGVEPTIAAKQDRSTQIQKIETVSGRDASGKDSTIRRVTGI